MSADWLIGLGALIGGGAAVGIGSGVISVQLRTFLVFAGAFLELVGLFLGIWPDLTPSGLQISRWLDRLYRLLGIPRNQDSTPGTGALLASVTDPIGVTAVAALEMSDHEKIEGLMKSTAALRGDVADLKAQNDKLQREWSERLADARRGIEVSFQQALSAKLEEYGPHRIAGFIVLVLGLALSTWANLLD